MESHGGPYVEDTRILFLLGAPPLPFNLEEAAGKGISTHLPALVVDFRDSFELFVNIAPESIECVQVVATVLGRHARCCSSCRLAAV